MLTVTTASDKTVRIAGSIDGSEDFDSLFGPLPQGLTIDCGGVTQINSTGIKAWIRYFGDPAKKSLGIRFSNFAVPLVEQLNLLRNFVGVGQLQSVALPFRCPVCATCFSRVFDLAGVGAFQAGKTPVHCPQCGELADFDDLPEVYFEFLARK